MYYLCLRYIHSSSKQRYAMKKFLLTACVTFSVGMVTPTYASPESQIDPLETIQSNCLGDTRSESEDHEDESVPSWSVSYTNGILSVTWYKIYANCCNEGFKTWIERDDNNLVFNIQELGEDDCDCMCTYNVTSTYGEIEPGSYTLTFGSWYGAYSTQIDITEGTDVNISYSPSGIRQLSDADLMSLHSDGSLHIASDGDFALEIFDASGMMRSRVESHGAQDINIKSLPQGIYTARLSTKDSRSTIRFIR